MTEVWENEMNDMTNNSIDAEKKQMKLLKDAKKIVANVTYGMEADPRRVARKVARSAAIA